MDTVKILVVEAEIGIANNICDNLEKIGHQALEPAISYSEAIKCIEEESPDIAILDIQLSGKKTGINLALKIRENYDFPFIFLTSNSEELTVNGAKQVIPSAFLAKPFSKDELYSAIEIALYNYALKVGGIIDNTVNRLIVKEAIFVKDKGAFIKINISDILYLESSHVNVDIMMLSGDKFSVRSSLNKIISNLSPSFIRIHRRYIINIEYLVKIKSNTAHIGEVKIPIGKKYCDEISKRIRTI